MRHLISMAVLLVSSRVELPQTISKPVECVRDSAGDQICIGTQPDKNICGYNRVPFGNSVPYFCYDVVVQKTAPGGQTLYTRVLGGESSETPNHILFDSKGNAVVFGTTQSKEFPTTPDAVQRALGNPPALISVLNADIFISVLSPAGELLYSTFLGSSGYEGILGIRQAPNRQADLLVQAEGRNFPLVPAGTPAFISAPVLLTFDLDRRVLARSGYLPISSQPDVVTPYSAILGADGTVAVTTGAALFTFQRDGQPRTAVRLEALQFAGLPRIATDSSGDVWLVGANKNRKPQVAKFIGGIVTEFNWMLPVVDEGLQYLFAALYTPFFAADGLVYLPGSISPANGRQHGSLAMTTSNALLRAPCSESSAGIVAVLTRHGELKLLSYLPGFPMSFADNPDGSVAALLSNGGRLPVELTERPRLVCATDALDRVTQPGSYGVGQVMRMRGGGFGPDSPVKLAPGEGERFPTSLDGFEVQVAGIPAAILSAAPGEVVFAIPFETPADSEIPVRVLDRGSRSEVLRIPVNKAAPRVVEPALNANGTPNGFRNPASQGSPLTIYLTGAGPYFPRLADGEVAPLDTSHRLELPVSVSFLARGPNPEPGVVLYAGPAPGFIGLAQIVVQPLPPGPYSSLSGFLTVGPASARLPLIYIE